MRGTCFVLVLLALPPAVSAQQVRRPEPAWSALGPIGLPLPSIGLPLPSIGLQPLPREPWRDPAPGGSRDEFRNPARLGARSRPSVVYVMPAYPWVSGPLPQTATPQAAVPAVTPLPPRAVTGRLRLEVEPAELLQLFVDGVYVGTPGDLGNEIDLRPGSRRIEIRAPGYQTLRFEAQIDAERAITYRGTLDPDPDMPAAPPTFVAPAGSRTMYVIPGCYLGNVSPKDLQLPAGCDLRRLSVYPQ
ncbi:MAG: hypothetical protein A3J29_21275 [Acidobacteria bacterium RIFCSPLOWO2_12_FULL_67_14b]|nr:MAG: hypothetical protein A3J29_21275 [Acidobacteria bacterium RIFCSPLOWO2_12_FULL_67_14b]